MVECRCRGISIDDLVDILTDIIVLLAIKNVTAILKACAQAGVKGVIDFGMGLTLREGDREYYYAALDRHFPGLKERYIRRYGNAYELPSPRAKELQAVFQRICGEKGMLSTPEACFAYLRELPEKYPQTSLFG